MDGIGQLCGAQCPEHADIHHGQHESQYDADSQCGQPAHLAAGLLDGGTEEVCNRGFRQPDHNAADYGRCQRLAVCLHNRLAFQAAAESFAQHKQHERQRQ